MDDEKSWKSVIQVDGKNYILEDALYNCIAKVSEDRRNRAWAKGGSIDISMEIRYCFMHLKKAVKEMCTDFYIFERRQK